MATGLGRGEEPKMAQEVGAKPSRGGTIDGSTAGYGGQVKAEAMAANELAAFATVLPIVHMNGTSREDLVSQRCEALTAIRDAMGSLARMTPNGRDYYPVDGLLQEAQEQHQRRYLLLRGLADEIEAEAMAISDL